jgi:ABC-type phosphate transport system substrate-binding protein
MRFTRTARITRAAAIVAASLAVVATSAISASAETSFVPDSDDVVLVGSDTTEFLLTDLANLYNGRTPTPVRRLATFDATGSATIQIRPNVFINRPNGSSAGITELTTPTSPAGVPPVDSARSSRGPKTTETGLAFLKFAQDQLRWMANSGVTGVTSLTDVQLNDIYNCRKTNWNQISASAPNLTIVPLIPQTSSGTRAEWAKRVGIADPAKLPACVTDQNATVQEHDPTPVKNTAGSIAPVSVGRYNRLTAAQKSGTFLGTIPPPDDAKYNRDVYQVVKLVSNAVPAYLADLFGDGSGASSTGGVPFVCEQANPATSTTEAGEVIAANGFVQLPLGTCGVRA